MAPAGRLARAAQLPAFPCGCHMARAMLATLDQQHMAEALRTTGWPGEDREMKVMRAEKNAVRRFAAIGLVAAAMGAMILIPRARGEDGHGPVFSVRNESGRARTINVSGFPVFATHNPFFLALGTNGRSCVNCHRPENNMTVTPASLQERFEETEGTDPIFRTNDGSNSPLADVSTVAARQSAYSMLLTKGLIRVGLPVPATAEFELAAVDEPRVPQHRHVGRP